MWHNMQNKWEDQSEGRHTEIFCLRRVTHMINIGSRCKDKIKNHHETSWLIISDLLCGSFVRIKGSLIL
jgi:hypothetical protein